MASVGSIVSRALRLVGVLDAGESAAAIDMQTGIEVLNALCTRIEADGLAIGWANVASPAEDMPTRPEHDEPIAYILAVRLGDEFRVSVPETVIVTASYGMSKMHADALRVDGARLDYDLPGNASGGRLAGFLGGR